MELNQVITDLGKEFSEFKQIHKNEIAEIKKGVEVSAETKSQMALVQASLDKLEAKFNEIKKQDAGKEAKSEREVAMSAYLRKGFDKLSETEKKALSTDSAVDGGYLSFENFSNEVIRKVREGSPIRQLARNFNISTGDSLTFVRQNGDIASAIKGERANNNNSTTPTLQQVRIQVYNRLATPYVTMDMIEDSAVNIEQFVAELAGEEFAIGEGQDFISGTGANEPEGVLTNSSVSIVDSGVNTSFDADNLIDLFYNLKGTYRQNSTWLMNRLTVAYVRKLKAGDDNYLWTPGISSEGAGLILGRPYLDATDLVAPVSGAYTDGDKPVVLGDFSRGYYVVNKLGMSVLRDPNSAYPFVAYRFRMRSGGAVAQPDAIKILRTT